MGIDCLVWELVAVVMGMGCLVYGKWLIGMGTVTRHGHGGSLISVVDVY